MQNKIIAIAVTYTVLELAVILCLLRKKKYGFVAESVAAYIALTVFLYFEYRLTFTTPLFVVVLVLATVLTHTWAGEYIDLYHKSTVFDRWLHLAGSFSFALFAYSIVGALTDPGRLPKAYSAVFVAALGMALGLLFEVAEFVHDTFTGKPPEQHGLKDTDMDMLFDACGAILAAIVSVFVFV